MLERFASCLNTPTRHIARKLRPRPKLHASFWHHGAGDLQLPSWWTVMEPIAAAVAQRDGDVGMLDFLYPPRTLALMRRISGCGVVGRREREKDGGARMRARERARRFSSWGAGWSVDNGFAGHVLAGMGGGVEQVSQHQFTSLMTEQPLSSYKVPDPLSLLQQTLADPFPAHSESPDYEIAWQLYLQLKPEERSQRIVVSLLNYISFSTRQIESVRSAFLLGGHTVSSQPGHHTTATSFHSAILSQIHRDALPNAVATHESAIQAGSKGYTGTNILLAHLLQRAEWDLALQVYSTKMSSLGEADKDWLGDDRTDVWDVIERLPDLPTLTIPFLFHARRRLDVTYTNIRSFITELVVKASLAAIDSGAPDKVWNMVVQLQKMDLASVKVYEILSSTVARELKETDFTHPGFVARYTLLRNLWMEYRSFPDTHPTTALMDQIAGVVLEHNLPTNHLQNRISEEQVLDDYKRFFQLSTLPNHVSLMLLRSYAAHGEVLRATDLFNELKKRANPELYNKIIPLWLAAHARGPNPWKTIKHFEDLQAEGWIPDPSSWAAVLEAYHNADHIDELFKTFNHLMHAKIIMTPQILHPILALLSSHGSAKIVIQVLELAKQQDVNITIAMFTSLINAHLATHALPAAVDAAESLTQAWKQGQLHGSVTRIWNPILAHVAEWGNFGAVNEMFARMQDLGVEVDGESYIGIVRALCKDGKVDAAERIVVDVLPAKGLVALPEHYVTLMNGLCQNGKHDAALKVYETMESTGIKRDDYCHVECIRAICGQNLRRPIKLSTRAAESDDTVATKLRMIFAGINKRGALEKATVVLIEEFGRVKKWSAVNRWLRLYQIKQGDGEGLPLEVLEALMCAALQCERHDRLESYWKKYLRGAETHARGGSMKLELSAMMEAEASGPAGTQADTAITTTDSIKAATATNKLKTELYTSSTSTTTQTTSPGITASTTLSSGPNTTQSLKDLLILSRREILSTPLNYYVQSLVARSENRDTISNLVTELSNKDWKLTSVAYNSAVRALVHKRQIAQPTDTILDEEGLPELRVQLPSDASHLTEENGHLANHYETSYSQHSSSHTDVLARPTLTHTPSPPLPRAKHILQAFSLAESHLSPNFPGWIKEHAQPLTQEQERGLWRDGHYWMDVNGSARGGRLQTLELETVLDLRDIIRDLERASATWFPLESLWEAEGDHSGNADPSPEDIDPRLVLDRIHAIAPRTVEITGTIPVLHVTDRQNPGVFGARMEKRGPIPKRPWGDKERWAGLRKGGWRFSRDD